MARSARSARSANIALTLASVLVSLLLIEAGTRLALGLPLFKSQDWRMLRITDQRVGEHAQFDPVLGWVPRANHVTEEHTTLDHGIRRNGQETELRTGQILAVGDSFTAGWDVADDDSWPAYLEKMTGTPVVNGGVAGYGTDQIVLRAEQLLPIVRPHTLIVGFLSFDIHRTGHKAYGAAKPWFTVEKGALVYHAAEQPEARARPSAWTRAKWAVRDWLARLAAVDFVMSRLSQNYWYGSEEREYIKADNDPVQVTCLLLERLKKQTDEMKVRAMLFMQYYAPAIIELDQPPEDARQVMACAAKQGFEVIDHFPPLKAQVRSNPHAMLEYYLVEDGVFQHMNGDGNEHAAAVVLEALRKK